MEEDGLTIRIRGNQKYRPFDCTVEGDCSQAAFWAELALLSGSKVLISGFKEDTRQGDRVIALLAARFGGKVSFHKEVCLIKGDQLNGINADLADCPDLGPALFAAAAMSEGKSVFVNTSRLRMKESDRISCMAEELRKLGVRIEDDADSLTIYGQGKVKKGTVFEGHNDHRIVMALAMIGAAGDVPVCINGAEAVNKSYPGFFKDLESVNVEVELYDTVLFREDKRPLSSNILNI